MHFRSEREVVRLRRVECLCSSKWWHVWCVRLFSFLFSAINCSLAKPSKCFDPSLAILTLHSRQCTILSRFLRRPPHLKHLKYPFRPHWSPTIRIHAIHYAWNPHRSQDRCYRISQFTLRQPTGPCICLSSSPLSHSCSVLPGLLLRPFPLHRVFAKSSSTEPSIRPVHPTVQQDTPSTIFWVVSDRYTVPFGSKRSILLKSKFDVDQREGKAEALRPFVVLYNRIPTFCIFVACQCCFGMDGLFREDLLVSWTECEYLAQWSSFFSTLLILSWLTCSVPLLTRGSVCSLQLLVLQQLRTICHQKDELTMNTKLTAMV